MSRIPPRAPPVAAIMKPGQGMAKLGPNTSTDRTVGSVQAPSPTMAGAELVIEAYTYFARPAADGQTAILYNGDRQSAQVTLVLETAGPVIVGQKQQLYPVTSGKGISLDTGVERSFTITKGNRLYIATTSINLISVVIQPWPWLEQITGILSVAVAGGGRR